MAVTCKLYGNAISKAFNGEIDWDTNTIRVMLCTSSYTPDQDAHEYKDDITNEITGTGYTAKGAALASKTNTYTAATNTVKLDAADVSWSSSTITARYAIVYRDTGTNSTSPLIGYVDFGENVSSYQGTFTITWNASGVASFVAA